jgi:Kef-type K+ transport system membrane component KefB
MPPQPPTALPGAAAAFSSGGSVLPTATAHLAVQLACVLCLCLLLHAALRPLRLPAVVAEKVAGILLGPSALGATAAGAALFAEPSLPALKAIANVGLVLYMFETGASLDIDDATSLLTRARLSLLVSASGVAVAAALGGAAAWALHARLEPPAPALGPFLLVACSALSLTALPVLCEWSGGGQRRVLAVAVTCNHN